MAILANDFNAPALYYNSVLGVGFATVSPGQLILAGTWSNMVSVVQSVAADQGRALLSSIPNISLYHAGSRIVNQVFPTLGPPPAPAVLTYTSSGFFVIPAGIHSIRIIQASAGGGGGGGGWENSNGSGGGGGGAGGYIAGYVYGMVPGQTVTVIIGAGGAGGLGSSFGLPGGNTQISFDSSLMIDIGGGGGGAAGAYTGLSNAGGAGGSPGGGDGSIGFGGSSDTASSIGGNGGSNPIGAGGAAGNGLFGLIDGSPGTGYGGGGGGGGFRDRTSPLLWFGGNGSSGYCQIAYPA